MKLESQVTSLELSKRLEELGVKQESLWYWVDGLSGWYLVQYDSEIDIIASNWISAFTVAELGEILPADNGKDVDGRTNQLQTEKYNDRYRVGFRASQELDVYDETEANARAKMLVYIIENKIVKVDLLNKKSND